MNELLLNQMVEAYRLISTLAKASDILLHRLIEAETRLAALETAGAIRRAKAP